MSVTKTASPIPFVTIDPAQRETSLHLRVFVASPGDVPAERVHAREVLQNLPYDPGLDGRITVQVVAWDHPGTDTPMLATMTPQAAIAEGLPKPSDCDIVIAIFWSRMGTPLPTSDPQWLKPDGSQYASGTEWEYLDALAAHRNSGKPEILVYRRTEKVLLDPDDPQFQAKLDQRNKVHAFFKTFRNDDGSIRGGINDYAAPEDFRTRLDAHLKKRVHDLLAKTQPRSIAPHPPVPPEPDWKGSPFPGLRAFTPEDAPIYFGRGRETDELTRLLGDSSKRFVLVAGASGSGKSSLVSAGLLPRLRANAVIGSKDWLMPWTQPITGTDRNTWTGLRFTPGELGNNPLLSLATKLAPLVRGENIAPRTLAAALEANPVRFVDLAHAALTKHPAWSEVLVFIDQFEELLTVAHEQYREKFVVLLDAAARAPRVRLVATIRADFYHRVIDAHPVLADALRERGNVFSLAAPGAGALFEMITGPAARARLPLDDELAQRLVDDTGNAPGGLALLAFALHELFEAKTSERRLTHAAYQAFNGVKGAIAKRADTTLEDLTEPIRASLPAVFGELVEVDERGLATRRRVPRAQLTASNQANALVTAFTDARLLVTDRGPDGTSVVEVAHEALLREWPRLTEWITARADDLRLLRQVEAAAAEWERAQRDALHLWPHERLVPVYAALVQLGKEGDTLAEPARSFVRPEVERILAELERPETTHQRRAAIGDRLDALGDPRPGVGLRADGLPDIVWCEIPPGTVTLDDGKGTFAVKPFHIAKYPVTFRQYQAFVDAKDGYRDQRWWKDLKREDEPGDQYRPTGNHPAENVSWYDAIAYCRWLSARLGYEIKLPTEWEWQAATGGDPAFVYPWGAEWAEGCANTSESRLSRTTAVGMYPSGASPRAVLDLAGNVWEWCLNLYEEPALTAIKIDESKRSKISERDDWMRGRRVLRGGSWDDGRDLARAACRYHLDPEFRNYGIGFRVLSVSPIRLNR